MNDDLVVIAVTGGFASGKTTVGKYIESKGYPVLFTDTMAKELMLGNPKLKEAIIAEFGSDSYSADGSLNSQLIAGFVFADGKEAEEKLNKLNQIVHPFVIDEMIHQIELLAKAGKKLVFVESALIFEAELEDGFDYIVVVASTLENQIKRATAKHKLTREQVLGRITKQISLAEKVKNADFVINNDAAEKDLIATVDFLLPIFATLKPKPDEESE